MKYDRIEIYTVQGLHLEYKADDLPEFVVAYLNEFYDAGWTPDIDAEWVKVFAHFDADVASINPYDSIEQIEGVTLYEEYEMIYHYEV